MNTLSEIDNGMRLITEESMTAFLNWLESGSETIEGVK